MATYTEKSFNEGPFWHPTAPFPLVFRTTSRTYANGDIVKLAKVERDTKILTAFYGGDRLDTNGAPSAAGQLELYDGTTTVALIALTTELSSATAASRTRFGLTNPDAVGYVVPTRGFWLQFRFTAALATAAAGVFGAGILGAGCMFGSESPLRPTG
jgi:hypothetical protein